MDINYILKYPVFFGDLLIFNNALVLCLKTYLKMHLLEIKKNELISLLFQVKENMTKEKPKKLKIEFHQIFSELIENVVSNFKNEDLNVGIIDNYGLAQLSLCSMCTQWIKTKEEVHLDKKEIERIFFSINNFVKREFGDSFFQLIKFLGIYDLDNVKLIISPRDAIIKASLIIKNIHPYELNSSLNSFILKKLDKYELLGLTSLEITAVEKKQFIEKFENILNLLIVAQRMEKYKDKNRWDFFNEFKGENKFLSQINIILLYMKKAPLLNLTSENQDLDLVIQKNEYLIQKNKELSEENTKALQDVEELYSKVSIFKTKVEGLENELINKKVVIKKMQENVDNLSNQLLEVNLALNESRDKINYHLHRKVCLKVENYFYNIISPEGRKIIDKELLDKKKLKIDAFLEKINEEYPKYFSEIEKEGIDYATFLYKINYFRKKNNSECHDKTKVNYNSIIKTLNKYFENSFDFKKHFDFMAKNFEGFKDYIFDFDESFSPEIELYTTFQKKEEVMKI